MLKKGTHTFLAFLVEPIAHKKVCVPLVDLSEPRAAAMLRADDNIKTADSVTTRQEEIKALKAGEPLPSHRVVQLRSMGMHSIRHEFVVRLLRSSLRMDTLSIYWEQGNDFMLKRSVESVHRRLVLGRRKHVSGEFADLWLLCYPDDEQIRELVEQEIDRMVREVSGQSAELRDEG